MKEYLVTVRVQVAESDKIEQAGEPDEENPLAEDEDYIRTELGWASDSFSGLNIESVEYVKEVGE